MYNIDDIPMAHVHQGVTNYHIFRSLHKISFRRLSQHAHQNNVFYCEALSSFDLYATNSCMSKNR